MPNPSPSLDRQVSSNNTPNPEPIQHSNWVPKPSQVLLEHWQTEQQLVNHGLQCQAERENEDSACRAVQHQCHQINVEKCAKLAEWVLVAAELFLTQEFFEDSVKSANELATTKDG